MNTAFFESISEAVGPEILGELSSYVGEVEQELGRQVQSKVRLVEQIGSHTLRAGGKRVRPALVYLSARSTGRPADRDRLVKLGACLEMIHMATLVHDDVIDGAETRRARATAAAVFGNTASILAGDVLLARAMRILAEDGDLRIIRLVSRCVDELSQGEVRELETRGEFELSEEEHLEILRMKTAVFIECCCEVGGLAAGADEEALNALRTFGAETGIAFQIVDDLLDYQGDPNKTGKPTATDFREGCSTMPLIQVRRHLVEEELRFAQARFGSNATDDEIDLLVSWMETKGAFARSQQIAEEKSRLGLEALQALPESGYRELMRRVASYFVEREA
ncbi:MAG: polyprenyl synthetase family protein [Fimbriimonadaceae bacterium]